MRHWARLSDACRGLALAAGETHWPAVAAEVLRLHPDASASVMSFVETRDDPGMLGVTVDLLSSADLGVAERAEHVVLRIASRALPTPSDDRPSRIALAHSPGPIPALDILVGSLVRALDHSEAHERSGPALVSLLLFDRPANDPDGAVLAPIRAVLHNADHPAFPVLRRLLRRDESPAMRRIAWRLLGDHPLAMAALERVARSGSAAHHNALLEHTHLLLHPGRSGLVSHLSASPRVRRAATSAHRDAALPQSTKSLSVRARRGLPRLLTAARAHADLRAAVHAEALVDPDVLTRLAFARHATGPELADSCFDQSPAVSQAAALRWSSVGVATHRNRVEIPAPHRARFAGKLARSPHESVRRIARDEPTDLAIDAGTPAGRTRLLALYGRDRAALADRLHASAGEGSQAERIEAIRVARRLRLLDGWLDTLTEIIKSTPDEASAHVAATAAAAIGDLPAGGAEVALSRAIGHPDPRVRANAIESIDRLSRRIGGSPGMGRRLTEMKTATEHRTRANAIRALSRHDDGRHDLTQTGDDLVEMLTDDRAPHRLAGVWLSERLLCGSRGHSERWQGLARHVASLARDEADAHIKARAVRCSRRLLGELAKPSIEPPRADPALEHTRHRLNQYAATHAGGAA